MIVTPEEKARIIAFAKGGHSPNDIVASLRVPGLNAGYVASIISAARRGGAIIPYRLKSYERRNRPASIIAKSENSLSLSVVVDQTSLDYLKKVGERRCIAPERVVEALVETVAREKLADAVLDDGVNSA